LLNRTNAAAAAVFKGFRKTVERVTFRNNIESRVYYLAGAKKSNGGKKTRRFVSNTLNRDEGARESH